MIEWSSLYKQYGECLKSPDVSAVERAIEEMDSSDGEHPNTWVTVGLAGDRMATLDYYPRGDLIFTVYKDQDGDEIEAEQKGSVSKFGTIPLVMAFAKLLEGDLAGVASIYSHVGA
jgi:hypothetical protein